MPRCPCSRKISAKLGFFGPKLQSSGGTDVTLAVVTSRQNIANAPFHRLRNMDAMKDDEDAPQLLPLLSHIKVSNSSLLAMQSILYTHANPTSNATRALT
jgi:hypothetical protein